MRGPDLSEAVTTYPAAEAALQHLESEGFGLIRLEDGDLLEGKQAREAIRGAIIAAVDDCDEGSEF